MGFLQGKKILIAETAVFAIMRSLMQPQYHC